MQPEKRIAGLLLMFPLAAASYWAVRRARADLYYGADTVEAAEHAARLDPGNARYHAWLAELQEHDGIDPTPALERAAALNPRDSAIRIRLGLAAEQRGDFAAAERALLEAARIDHQFDPRATLANYYFRRAAAGPFWRWAREAFAVGYGDLTPLFQLCWRMTGDPAVVRAALPGDHAVLGRYLAFLLAENRLDAAAPVAREFGAEAAAADRDLLLATVDRLLQAGNAAALAVWNPLCGRLLPFAPLDPDRGVSLTNPTFHVELVQRGFDWRVARDPEITVARGDALRISMSGRQPESCELAAQYVPLAAHRQYRLRVHYRTAGLPPESGLRWRILGAALPLRASDEWNSAEMLFSSDAASTARLALVYQRPAGRTRAEGSITLRGLELSP